MSWIDKIKKIRSLPLVGLLITILLSSIFLITINYYSLRTMSAVRAYINGESNYSKGEKEATISLLYYLHSGEKIHWDNFKSYIDIPVGDSVARNALLSGGARERAREGLLQGQNHEADIDDMMWLFENFQDIELMEGAIDTWRQADSVINRKYVIAQEIQASINEGSIDSKRGAFLTRINENGKVLTELEKEFSANLGAGARSIRIYLFYANVIIVLLILTSVSIYVLAFLRRLELQNKQLQNANKELDRLAYGVSHDLRAPIHSMLGLVNVARVESDSSKFKSYLDMIQKTLNKQERFIKEMITISKENRLGVKKGIIELDYLIDQVIGLHEHMPEAKGIKFSRKIGVHRVFSDSHRLEIVLNNLVSNAIKYHDPNKEKKKIEIITRSEGDKVCIDVADNGLGIEGRDKTKIFEMYYMSSDRKKGSGLGLFIVKEAIEKLQGKVEVKSVKGEGSTFTVVLNK